MSLSWSLARSCKRHSQVHAYLQQTHLLYVVLFNCLLEHFIDLFKRHFIYLGLFQTQNTHNYILNDHSITFPQLLPHQFERSIRFVDMSYVSCRPTVYLCMYGYVCVICKLLQVMVKWRPMFFLVWATPQAPLLFVFCCWLHHCPGL